jgi:gliding motility-associated-like protein
MRNSVNILLIFLIGVFSALGQPSNDGCSNPLLLCPNQPLNSSNVNATATVCPDCEDDFTFCFSGSNSVWFSFTTNTTGGNVTIDFSNLLFQIQPGRGSELQACIVEAIVPCDAATYSLVGNCVNNATGNFSLNATGLPPNTQYYVIVNGARNGGATLPAEASFTLTGSGSGFDRLPAAVTIGGPTGTICPSTISSFTAYLSNCQDTSDFYWEINDTLRAITQTSLWQTSTIKEGDVVRVTCSCFAACPDTITITYGPISVDNLFVNAGMDVTIESGQSIVLQGISNGSSIIWTPPTGLSSPNSLTTIASPQTTTTYALTALSATCSLIDQLTVYVSDNLEIPGSFSPNGDGTNDTWVIQGIAFYPDAQVQIYDRWGQTIAEISGYSQEKAWDGTNNGKPVSDGVYFYSLNLSGSGEDKIIKGSITLIR